jgi:hypothetical protein
MRLPLKPHPDSPCAAVAKIEVEVAQPRANRLDLTYIVAGKIGDVRIPEAMPASRGDKLWQHTCFEVFVRASSGDGYYEFNFSPSTQWAAYRFNSHRSGMSLPAEVGGFAIDGQGSPGRYALQTSVDLDRLSGLPRTEFWLLGLSVIIEETSGRMSYWALAHPPGKADFHHIDCFAHRISLAVQP